MRKVQLTMGAQEKYEIIKRLAENHISKNTAALKIGCTVRHINRLLIIYRQKGKEGFLHGNTGRLPVHALTDQQKAEISRFITINTGIRTSSIVANSLRQMTPFAFRPPHFAKSFITSLSYPLRRPDVPAGK